MTIRLPAASDQLHAIDGLTPREIVEALDRHVVGQTAAKRAVAIALRNRLRRQRLPPEVAAEITPRNILMIGPTGVGKTEIARRLAKLSKSPFVKVEASKFTEVGYVGRDVESMIRDLVASAVELVRQERLAEVREQADSEAEERLLDHLLPASPRPAPAAGDAEAVEEARRAREQFRATREKLRQQLRSGDLDEREVDVEVRDRGPSFQLLTNQGAEEMDVNVKDLLPGLFGGRTQKRRLKLPAARDALRQEAEERLIDSEQVARAAVERAESSGIVFIDEIDKIAGREGSHGPEISREGVQRDILPIVEGTTVSTKQGPVSTDHVLFVAAGAFHVSKPSDLIPELQGRFPIRVELESLGQRELVRILTEPKSALLEQYRALLSTDGVDLVFTDEAVEEIARLAMQVNQATENIGARRLATLMETVLEEISFDGPHLASGRVEVDAELVRQRVAPLVSDRDLSRFIL